MINKYVLLIFSILFLVSSPILPTNNYVDQNTSGSNLVLNGTFDNTSDWTLGSGASIGSGVLTVGTSPTYQSDVFSADQTYQYSIDCISYSADVLLEYYNGSYQTIKTITGTGTFTGTFTISGTPYSGRVYITSSGGSGSTVDNFTITPVTVSGGGSGSSTWSGYGANSFFAGLNSAGANNGTSWSNEWALGSMNWNNLRGGDTLWVDGGSAGDSVVYPLTIAPSKSGSAGNIIVISKGMDAGHNGKVVIDGNNRTRAYCIDASSASYIKYRDMRLVGFGDRAVNAHNTDYNCFDLLDIYNAAGWIGIDIKSGVIGDTVENCNYSETTNSHYGDGDFCQMSESGGLVFKNNYVILSDEATSDHTDAFQGYAMTGDCLFDGNYVIHTDNKPTANGQGFYLETSNNVRWTLINNVVYFPNDKSGINMNNTGGYNASITLYNNIFYQGTGGKAPMVNLVNGVSNMIIKNNIFVTLANTSSATAIYFSSTPSSSTIDYNRYYAPNNGNLAIYAGGTKSFSSWQALGFDAHGSYGDPGFTSSSPSVPADFTLSSGSPCIGAGTNLYSIFQYDYYKAARPSSGAWDIGAYEYSSSNISSGVKISIKVFLSGAYENDAMTTILNDKGFLPLMQPYGASPWNYNGQEKVSKIPSGVVDWVLVQLRNGTSSSNVIATRAAFLKNNGSIVDLDGTSPLLFSSVVPGAYYIVIMHRNHIGVMSANKINLSMNTTSYDFTNSESKAYGNNAMENLGDGNFGLYSGDANADGTVSQSDIINVWLPQFLNSQDGYQSADLNLDGSVTASDNNMYWLINNGISTQIPN